MRRFFVEQGSLVDGAKIQLDGDEFHHLKNVCRLEEGERVELLDGRGLIALSEIETLGKRSATLKIIVIQKMPEQPAPHVRIILGVPRFQKMDLIIQKCVELGATEVTPVVSDRSFVKKLSKELDGKVGRWNKVAIEACKQSGRAWPMKIGEFSRLQDEVEKFAVGGTSGAKDSGLFLYEGDAATDIKSALQKFATTPRELNLFIGAEGGFSPEEVSLFKAKGLKPVTLGPLVLRVETACITILSIIQYHFDLMR